jgi:hypothetical protein
MIAKSVLGNDFGLQRLVGTQLAIVAALLAWKDARPNHFPPFAGELP